MKALFTLAILCLFFVADAQIDTATQTEPEAEIFEIVEYMPQFPGGDDSLKVFIARNIIYPSEAIENGKSGKVYVQFIVEADGSLSNVKIAKGVDPLLDAEALRVIRAMPKWFPGKQRGKSVRTKVALPIVFKLL